MESSEGEDQRLHVGRYWQIKHRFTEGTCLEMNLLGSGWPVKGLAQGKGGIGIMGALEWWKD